MKKKADRDRRIIFGLGAGRLPKEPAEGYFESSWAERYFKALERSLSDGFGGRASTAKAARLLDRALGLCVPEEGMEREALWAALGERERRIREGSEGGSPDGLCLWIARRLARGARRWGVSVWEGVGAIRGDGAKAMLAVGAPPNGIFGGVSPISAAAAGGDERAVRALVAAGADPEGDPGEEASPLLRALEAMALGSARELEAAGASAERAKAPKERLDEIERKLEALAFFGAGRVMEGQRDLLGRLRSAQEARQIGETARQVAKAPKRAGI